ncbi:MAG: large subunit ribosomal protein [Candidatus Woesearchaeota archaeon]|nr:large subunit ribosomal protein [Candidatus Woesearchaeota archaeon]MDN5327989.1 large subunit ribosomal protein [Candidatus Woesearchaeota archaeon]
MATESKLKNPMREVRIEKVTLNIGAGRDVNRLEGGVKLLERITGRTPIKTRAKHRIPNWDIRPGLQIGVKVTVRGKEAEELLARLFEAVSNKISSRAFDDRGNFSFGIPEYIEIPGLKYDHSIGLFGLQVCVTLSRRGFRIAHRKIQRKSLNKKVWIGKEEAIDFIKSKFKVDVV